MSKLYDFSVIMCGWGNTPEEAWRDCQESFDILAENVPIDYTVVDDDEGEL